MSSSVKEMIDSIKEKIQSNNGSFEIDTGEGEMMKVTCTFRKPATEKEIKNFESKTGLTLPKDYRDFLLLTNGCKLFHEARDGGESELYSIKEIMKNQHEDPYEGCFSIGYIYQDNLVVNSGRYEQGNSQYTMIKDCIDEFDEGEFLHINFEEWLGQFVKSDGEKFWEE